MENLSVSENHYFPLVESINIGIVILNKEGFISATNSYSEEMYHLSKNQLRGKRFIDFFIKKDQELVEQGLKKCLIEKSFNLDSACIKRDSGEFATVELSAKLATLDKQDVILIAIKDVTERMGRHRQILLQDRLKATSTLAAGIAQEINNPAAFIYTNLRYAVDELKNLKKIASKKEDVNKLMTLEASLKQALEGIDRINTVVKGLRGFTHIDDREMKALNLNEVIDASINVILDDIEAVALLEKNYEAACSEIVGNAGRLQQMFANIMLNAVQAIQPGHKDTNKITVKTHEKNGGIRIDITDTGKGMSDAVIAQVFDPFFTAQPLGKATGLGLSVCYDIVRGHRGDIEVKSDENAGTMVSIFLPYDELKIPAKRKVPVTQAQTARAKNLNLLIVDDEVYLLESLKRILENDYHVTTASTVKSALELIQKNPSQFDIILADIIMPEMNGTDLYRQVKEKYPNLKDNIIFMTGGAFTEKVQSFIKEISNHMISKPFKIEELRKVIDEIQV